MHSFRLYELRVSSSLEDHFRMPAWEWVTSYYMFFKEMLCIYLTTLDLRCCVGALVAASRGCSSLWCSGVLIVVVFLLQSAGS